MRVDLVMGSSRGKKEKEKPEDTPFWWGNSEGWQVTSVKSLPKEQGQAWGVKVVCEVPTKRCLEDPRQSFYPGVQERKRGGSGDKTGGMQLGAAWLFMGPSRK